MNAPAIATASARSEGAAPPFHLVAALKDAASHHPDRVRPHPSRSWRTRPIRTVCAALPDAPVGLGRCFICALVVRLPDRCSTASRPARAARLRGADSPGKRPRRFTATRAPSSACRGFGPPALPRGGPLPSRSFYFPDPGRAERVPLSIDLGILILTYVMLGWGLNIVVGLAGLLDLGYVAFYAVGAYSYALLVAPVRPVFWICLPLAGTSPPSGASFSASRCCGCAATISRS